MPIVYETKSFRRHWGGKRTGVNKSTTYEIGYLAPDSEKMDNMLEALIDELNDEGWEIKSAIPLVSSEYSTVALQNSAGAFQSSWGAGHGYGAPFTQGVVLICQRRVEVSTEEIANRKASKLRGAKVAEEVAAIRKEPIQELQRGLFKTIFLFDGAEYQRRDQAEAAREAKAAATENQSSSI